MIWWVWVTLALCVWGLSSEGIIGVFRALGVMLMILPFWFVIWVVWQVPM